MKKIIYFFLVLSFTWACKTQEELLKTQIIPDTPMFEGEFLGKTLNLQAKVNDWREVQPKTSLALKPDSYNFTGWNRVSYIKIYLGMEKDPVVSVDQSMNLRFLQLIFPSIESLSLYNELPTIRQHFQKGRRVMLQSTKAVVGMDKISDFVIRTQIERNREPLDREIYSTDIGDQPANALEIVEVKEVPPLYTSITNRFIIKMRINCRLYKTDGTYVGDLKGVLVNTYDYFPIK